MNLRARLVPMPVAALILPEFQALFKARNKAKGREMQQGQTPV
jgi:hypothetical protein